MWWIVHCLPKVPPIPSKFIPSPCSYSSNLLTIVLESFRCCCVPYVHVGVNLICLVKRKVCNIFPEVKSFLDFQIHQMSWQSPCCGVFADTVSYSFYFPLTSLKDISLEREKILHLFLWCNLYRFLRLLAPWPMISRTPHLMISDSKNC